MGETDGLSPGGFILFAHRAGQLIQNAAEMLNHFPGHAIALLNFIVQVGVFGYDPGGNLELSIERAA